ncbi:hypothetical protein SB2_06665 [Methylobacterium radiotolerans]|nr:hypothetical protein SB3_08705 [Methylobacterium radiotolerans]KTS49237.1 hypothetical protein SB2_06665 [Methylobacterium radiotolerans]
MTDDYGRQQRAAGYRRLGCPFLVYPAHRFRHDDAFEWLVANITGGWRSYRCGSIVEYAFGDPDEAFLFRMRWA